MKYGNSTLMFQQGRNEMLKTRSLKRGFLPWETTLKPQVSNMFLDGFREGSWGILLSFLYGEMTTLDGISLRNIRPYT